MGYNYAPTRTSEKTIAGLVDVLCRYYGVAFSLRFDDSAPTSSINLQSGEIVLPSWLKKANQPKIVAYANHEPWHAMPSRIKSEPKTKHRKLLLEARTVQNGIEDAQFAVNLIADLIINDAALDDTPFPEDLPIGFESLYKQMRARAKRNQDSLFTWFAETNLMRLREKMGKSFKPTNPPELYDLLYHDERSLDLKFDEICRRIKPFFEHECPRGRSSACGYDSDELPPITDPDEYKKWARDISKMAPKNVFEAGKAGGLHERRVLMDYAELRAFETFVIAVRQAELIAQKKQGSDATYEPWHLEDPIEQLDITTTLKRRGLMVPGVTALKRVGEADESAQSQGRGIIVFVLDRSGSMSSDIALVAVLCWAAVLCAQRRGDEVAMASFGEIGSWLLHPCKDYAATRKILEEVDATEASTYLAPSLKMIREYATEKGLKPTVIVFSDCAIFDDDEAVKELRNMRQLEGQTIIASTTPINEQYSTWVSQVKQEGLAEVFQVDYDKIGDIANILTKLV
jgi:Mg-chelatase subunit ChlD